MARESEGAHISDTDVMLFFAGAAHVSDAACLDRLAIEKAKPGAKYHAVAEEGVPPLCGIGEAIGRRRKMSVRSIAPEQTRAYFGWQCLWGTTFPHPATASARNKLG